MATISTDLARMGDFHPVVKSKQLKTYAYFTSLCYTMISPRLHAIHDDGSNMRKDAAYTVLLS